MIAAHIIRTSDSENLLLSAYYLAKELVKDFCVIFSENNSKSNNENIQVIKNRLDKKNLPNEHVYMIPENESIVDFCESYEVNLLLVQSIDKKSIKNQLKLYRDLRIPYLFFNSSFPVLNLKKIIVPVSYLPEEYEKAQFAAAFGRFCKSNILILQSNDYGSKATTTVHKMSTFFDKFNLDYTIKKAKSDSYKINKESVRLAEEQDYDMILISASREYGLDDILFGPSEYHLLKKSNSPILLINPRHDLYTLCD